jgi:hypothetical protein
MGMFDDLIPKKEQQDQGGLPGGLLTPYTASPWDYQKFPKVKNPDGSFSNVKTASYNIDGKEVLLPTMAGGKNLRRVKPDRSVDDAAVLQRFRDTGEHFGIFDKPESAQSFATQLEAEMQQGESQPAAGGGMFDDLIPNSAAPVPSRVQRGGFAAQVGRTMEGKTPLTLTPEQKAQNDQFFADVTKGVPIGLASSVPGMPGDVEGLGRLALSPLGVSRETFLPGSEAIGNMIGGEPRSRQEAGARMLGGLIGPPAALGGARKLGQASAGLVKGGEVLPAAQEARTAGYVVPPNMAQQKPSLLSQGLSMLGGKVKTQQAASAKNQQVTNAIAAKELGVDATTPLTKQTFEAIRSEAGKAYGAVAQAMPQVSTDLTFASGVKQLGGRATQAAKDFPGVFENGGVERLVQTLSNTDKFSTQAALDTVRQLRADAGSHLKAFDDPAKKALGQAQRAAADLLDGLIERRLAQGGNATLMNDYRQARQLIAKSHDVESATNLATGEVSARDLARMADKGRPLTGGLAAIAKMGGAFPKAAQDVATFGGTEGLGIMDAGVGLLGAGMGRPEILGAMLGRPLARGAILSNPYQNAVLGARNANVPGASSISPGLLGLMGGQNLLRLSQPRNEPR